jgi:hypothetical protein
MASSTPSTRSGRRARRTSSPPVAAWPVLVVVSVMIVAGLVAAYLVAPGFVHGLDPAREPDNTIRAALAVAAVFLVAAIVALINLAPRPPLEIAIPPSWDAALQLVTALALGILISLSVFR